ncbi:MAG: GumC family protein [Candidatus Scalinduaceae bacterium]
MELREYLRIILTHRKLIISLTLVTTIVATLGGFTKTSVYEATTTILIKSALSQPQFAVPGLGFTTEQNIQTKGETLGMILKSKAVAEKVVDILELDKSLGKKKIQKEPPRIISIIKGIISVPRNLIGFLKYGKVKKQKTDPRLGLIQSIQGSISTELLPKTSVIKASVVSGDPKLAADIADTAAKVFVDHIKEMNSTEARVAKEFIAERIVGAEEYLENTQDALRQFIKEEGVADPESEMPPIWQALVNFKSDLKRTEAEIEQTRINYNEISQKLSKHDKTLKKSATTIINPLVQELKAKLANLETKRSNFSVDYGPLHPKILSLEKEIKKTKFNLESEVKRVVQSELTEVNPIYQELLSNLVFKEIDISVLQEKKKAFVKIIKGFPSELRISAEKTIKWESLSSSIAFAQKNLDSLKEQLEKARITEAQKLSEMKVIDTAIPPLLPKGLPKIGYTILGLLVGLMGGIGLAFLLEYIDDSIKTIEMIEDELKLPVYGVIPEIKLQAKRKKKRRRDITESYEISMLEERLVTHTDPRSPIAEAYRSFRTNIQFADISEKTKILLVTSSLKAEGKTTTVANLAITMAQLGNRIILIDGDLRNPMIHSIFGKQKEPGLTNLIGGFTNLDKIITASGIENLDIIPSGPIPPNPSELLSSKGLSELIDNIKANYDFILFDSPPIIAVTDAVILSSKVHGVFLVVKQGKTSKHICLRAKILLEKANANLLGSVLNNVKVESRYGYEYYYQYYYGEKKKSQKSV